MHQECPMTHEFSKYYEVIGYDINEEFVKNLLPIGLKQANNLSDIAEDTDIVITMLPNGDIVEEVYDIAKKYSARAQLKHIPCVSKW